VASVNPIFNSIADPCSMLDDIPARLWRHLTAVRRWLPDITGIARSPEEDSMAPSHMGYFDTLRRESAYAHSPSEETRLFTAVGEIERFNLLRETLGFELADRVVSTICERLVAAIGDCEIGRADRTTIEFAFRARSLADARARLIAATAAVTMPITCDGVLFELHLLIGATDTGRGPISLAAVKRAEAALEEARRRHVRLFISETDAPDGNADRLALVRDLQTAVTRGELALVYQPKLRNRSWTIDAVEALLRWRHPVRGDVPPDIFIPIAEETGCIRSLTEWVVERAIADRASLAEQGCPLTVDINLSGLLADDLDFVAWLLARLPDVKGGIGFEITETATIADQERAEANLAALAAAGARIAIDDYGAAFSSLAYLQRLPLKELKIDKSFISSLASNQRDPLLVRSTIDLAHAMELEVTAEGVDTPEAMALLRVMGCDLLQGYLISKPLGVDALREFVLGGGQQQALDQLPGVGRALRERATATLKDRIAS